MCAPSPDKRPALLPGDQSFGNRACAVGDLKSTRDFGVEPVAIRAAP